MISKLSHRIKLTLMIFPLVWTCMIWGAEVSPVELKPIPLGFGTLNASTSKPAMKIQIDTSKSKPDTLPVYRVVSKYWTEQSVQDYSNLYLDAAKVRKSGTFFVVETNGLRYRFNSEEPGIFSFIEKPVQGQTSSPDTIPLGVDDFPDDVECKKTALDFWKNFGYVLELDDLELENNSVVLKSVDRTVTILRSRSVIYRQKFSGYISQGLVSLVLKISQSGTIYSGYMFMPEYELVGHYPLRTPFDAATSFAGGEGWSLMRVAAQVNKVSIVYRTTQGYIRPCYELYGIETESNSPVVEGQEDSEVWIGSIDALDEQYLFLNSDIKSSNGPSPFVSYPEEEQVN